jgi:hypothetical protein
VHKTPGAKKYLWMSNTPAISGWPAIYTIVISFSTAFAVRAKPSRPQKTPSHYSVLANPG